MFGLCVCLCVCVSQKVCLRTWGKDVYLWLLVFSPVSLIIHRCCKKPTIIVVSFLFFSFHKDLSTARGALRLLLGSQILLFLFSLPAKKPLPPLCLFFEADVNRCLQRAVYLSLPRLVLSSDPRVNAFQRSIILCFYGLPMGGWKGKKGERHALTERK